MKSKNAIRDITRHFPILKSKINGQSLSYLDNAAMTQVPKVTIKALEEYYSKINSNIHRGVYYLSEIATEKYENTRKSIKKFINASDDSECIFVKNTTEAINLIANSYIKKIAKKNDEIIISQMEHHSNIVPWYLICKEIGTKLKIIPLMESGDINYDKINGLISNKTKLISIVHISNSIGTINDIKTIIQLAHSKNVPVLIDGAQSISHNFSINIKELECDFFAMSAHKMYGPNGLGILCAKKKILENMNPYQGGGDMIKYVSFSNIIWNDIPYKFEAGTQSIANVIAFGETIKFLESQDLVLLNEYKKNLFEYTINRLSEIKNLKIIGTPKYRSSIVSFTLNNIHPHDLGTIANHYGIAIRTGHHCTMPIMDFYKIPGTARVSLSFYNNKNDINKLINCILEAQKIFK